MVKRSWILVACFAVSSMSWAREPRTLELVWLDHQRLLPSAPQARAEAGGILRELGADVHWEVGTDPRPADPCELRVQVVLMPTEPATWKLPKNAMGAVLLPDRRQQQTVYLFYPALLRNSGLGRKANEMLSPREQKDLARVVARVLVHEVIHAVAPNLTHADAGLMHDSLRSAALSKSKVSVDARTRQAFLQGLAATDGSDGEGKCSDKVQAR